MLAALVGARRQPGYSARGNHVSGLAATGTRSAVVMVPGFLVLGAAQLVMEEPDPLIRRVVRLAGLGTVAAGLLRCSTVECPDPLSDPAATLADAAHSAASVATFVLWVSLPGLEARVVDDGAARRGQVVLGLTTATAFGAAGLTTALESPNRGLAQRLYLGLVFGWFIRGALRWEERVGEVARSQGVR